MKNFKHFVFLLLALFAVTAQANPFGIFLDSFDEQKIAARWIVQNAQAPITETKAMSIVRRVYIHSKNHEINPLTVLAVMRTESGFISKARSGYGAKGLLQVVPRFHKDKLRGRDPFNESVSIEVGSKILSDCFNKHKQNKYRALNCYSGGGGKKYHRKVNTFQYRLREYMRTASRPQATLLALNSAQ